MKNAYSLEPRNLSKSLASGTVKLKAMVGRASLTSKRGYSRFCVSFFRFTSEIRTKREIILLNWRISNVSSKLKTICPNLPLNFILSATIIGHIREEKVICCNKRVWNINKTYNRNISSSLSGCYRYGSDIGVYF